MRDTSKYILYSHKQVYGQEIPHPNGFKTALRNIEFRLQIERGYTFYSPIDI